MSSPPQASRTPDIGRRGQVWTNLLKTPRPLIMGVVNVTPDSFSDGGRFFGLDAALARGRALAAAGADILDIGGESTRPFADPVPLEEELRRVIPVIATLSRELDLPISIDTYKAPVAQAALEAGASLINDISAMRFDPHMAPLAARVQAPVVLMHMQGTPKDMQAHPHYHDLLGEIKAFFRERLDFALSQGLARDLLILDLGIGFGKTLQHNLKILNQVDYFLDLGCPLLVGPSRKAFIGRLLDLPNGEVRDIGTLAALGVAVMGGAKIVRTHNVAYARQFLTVLAAIRAGDLPAAASLPAG